MLVVVNRRVANISRQFSFTKERVADSSDLAGVENAISHLVNAKADRFTSFAMTAEETAVQ